ncbi:MAG TPA: hypothetical protein VML19_15645 [Verrucomicrobiae bacterium]|nr:hypothetical protein [Verrucomicrobiae bacterium]
MNRGFMVLALLAVPAWAQEAKRAQFPTVDEELQKSPTYQFQFATSAGRTVDFVQALVGNSAHLAYYPAMNIVIIRAYNPGDADKVIALLKKYDISKPEVEFTTYLVMGLPAGHTWTGGKPLPAELESAVEQMKQTLGDRAYSLRDIIHTHAIDGADMDSGLSDSSAATYSLAFDQINTSRETKTVQIGEFHFSIKPCPQAACKPVGITNMGVVIPEGQKLVFGKLPVFVNTKEGSANADLYLIVTVKIQDAPKK